MRMLKFMLLISLLLVFQSSFTSPFTSHLDTLSADFRDENPPVLSILENKCNACHLKKRKVVFTSENISEYYLLIESQVLVKKKMPKGKAPQLTAQEKEIIASWINSLKN